MFSIGRVHATVFTNYSGPILFLDSVGKLVLLGKNSTPNFIAIHTEYLSLA
jgi:hypothetical protein